MLQIAAGCRLLKNFGAEIRPFDSFARGRPGSDVWLWRTPAGILPSRCRSYGTPDQSASEVCKVSLAYTPEAEVGKYVLVHVGFAISVIDEAEAKRVFQYLEELGAVKEELGEIPQ